jgi:hypothetical protein
LLEALAYAEGWQRHETSVLPLFFTGLVVIFVAGAWRLLDPRTQRRERLQVSVLLGTALLASYYLRSPYLFDSFDELLHQATLWKLGVNRQLFAPNTVLPVSPYYPGLELCTLAVRWLTGMPVVLCELAVVAAARIMLVLAIFLTVERLCASSFAGGVGVLTYVANPQFYSFDAQYAYETLALGFAAAAVYFLVISADERAASSPDGTTGVMALRDRWRTGGREFALSAACLVATAITHHLVSWLIVGLLLVLAPALHIAGRRAQARVATAAAVLATAVTTIWSSIAAGQLGTYLSPLIDAAVAQLRSVLSGHVGRQLFQGANGYVTPRWEELVMLAAAGLWCAVIALASFVNLRHPTVLGGRLRHMPAIVACLYPAVLLSRLAPGSAEVGGRASAFVFFGAAVVVAGWLASRRTGWRASVGGLAAAVVVASVCFLGSTLLGSGPDFANVPGPYLVAADGRSVDAASLAAASWEASHLPVDSRIAADRVNGALAAGVGHLAPVTGIGGGVNVGPLYFDRSFGPFDLSVVLGGDIRYLLVDQRLAAGRPVYGVYFEPGETPTPQRLSAGELSKFARIPGVRRVYDNGPIQIYDLSTLLGLSAAAANGADSIGAWATSPDPWLLGLATLGLLVVLRHLRRSRPSAEQLLRMVTWSATGLGLAALAVVPSAIPVPVVGATTLGAVIVLTLRATSRLDRARPGGRAAGGSTVPITLLLAGVVLAAGAFALAPLAARTEWTPPPELSLMLTPAGGAVVQVELGSAVRGASLVATRGRTVWQHRLPAATAPQEVLLPLVFTSPAATIRLVVAGVPARSVSG